MAKNNRIVFIKLIYIVLGSLSLLLGIIGIVIPGLPTTPFLLVTAWLYMKGSTRFYNWLIANKWLGSYIIQYQKNKGMSLRMKVFAITMMGVMIAISTLFFIHNSYIKIAIVLLGVIGTAVILFVVPTVNFSSNNK